MLNALIVDDEKLVRKGLIATMPWDHYDIRIVGEAGNGRAALELMEQQSIDLMFVDLTMPTMSGFELMKVVRTRYPKTWIVVLTCHQDFEYVQEAMRAGAIDYVVKTQLDKESMDEILSRIVQRIDDERALVAARLNAPASSNEEPIWLIASRHLSASEDLNASAQLMEVGSNFLPIGDNIWSIVLKNEELSLKQFVTQIHDFVLLKVYGNPRLSSSDIRQFLYYECQEHLCEYELRLPLPKEQHHPNDILILDEMWFSFNWLHDEKLWDDLIKWIERVRPDLRRLQDTFRISLKIWRELFHDGELDGYDIKVESMGTWQEHKRYIRDLRDLLLIRMSKLDYFNDIVTAVMRSLYFMRQQENSPVSRNGIAAKINMSGGYFSECFKAITGRSFGDYMKKLQMDKAKMLLESTEYPIYRIAELSGYKDDKYFSKIFRENVGVYPAEYRRAHMKGARSSNAPS